MKRKRISENARYLTGLKAAALRVSAAFGINDKSLTEEQRAALRELADAHDNTPERRKAWGRSAVAFNRMCAALEDPR